MGANMADLFYQMQSGSLLIVTGGCRHGVGVGMVFMREIAGRSYAWMPGSLFLKILFNFQFS